MNNVSSNASHTPLVHAVSDPNFLFSLSTNRAIKKNQQQWTDVKSKRKRSPNQVQPGQKQAKLDYWLGPDKLSNRFESLQNVVDDQDDQEVIIREPKPPPLFVEYVANILPLLEKLNEVAKDKYTLKVIGTERIKIQTLNKESYSAIYKALEEKGTQFHTYEIKANRAFRVVLKYMHPTTDLVELKQVLTENGHEVRNIHNLTRRGTKQPLPFFFVDLEPKPNNKEIYKIEFLMYQKIKFEAPHIKREIPQCSRCQRYGHTKKFCHYYARCVKCAGSHETAKCIRKERDRNVLCVLCEGNHPANYKGCGVFQELRDKSFPSLRTKDKIHQPQDEATQSSRVQPNKSYAQAAREQNQQAQFLHNVTELQGPSGNGQSNDIVELKQMMKDLMTQMGTMLNLLTTLVAKLK